VFEIETSISTRRTGVNEYVFPDPDTMLRVSEAELMMRTETSHGFASNRRTVGAFS